MQKYYLCFLAVLIAATACSKKVTGGESVPVETNEPDGIAIRTSLEYQYESDLSYITDKEEDFVDDEIRMAMSQNPRYHHLLTKSGSGESDDSASMSVVHVPICEGISQRTDIFYDGHSEVEIIKEIGPEGNPAVALFDTPVDMSCYVARIVIKDGVQQCYNSNNELLYEEPAEEIDYSEYISALKEVMEQVEAESQAQTKSGVKRDINWLRLKMKDYAQTTKADNPDMFYSISELPDGNVLLEQSISVGTKAGIGIQKVKMELSPDISRVEHMEMWDGDTLKERKAYTYNESNPKLQALYAPKVGDGDYNPETIVTESVITLEDGTPMLKTTKASYIQNQTIYYFNK